MGRKSKGPRLWLDKVRNHYAIRDAPDVMIRLGIGDREAANKQLDIYLAQKHKPKPSNDPLITDVITVYVREHVPHLANSYNAALQLRALLPYWTGKRVSAITAQACRGYKDGRGRRELETLKAAVRYWHREYGPLSSVPAFVLPPKGAPRERWLTRSEAARLLWAARHVEHLKRFLLLGLHTGSRKGVLFALRWEWMDFERGVMRRRAPGEREIANKRRPPVRVGRRLLAFLRRWHRADGGGNGHVVHIAGQRITHLMRSWASATVAAGLGPDVTPHVLRHTRATWLMQAGVPIWEASGHLGMTPAVLQSVYGHHHPDFQGRAADV
jgi:integrase